MNLDQGLLIHRSFEYQDKQVEIKEESIDPAILLVGRVVKQDLPEGMTAEDTITFGPLLINVV